MEDSFFAPVIEPKTAEEAKPQRMIGDADGNWRPADNATVVWARAVIETESEADIDSVVSTFTTHFTSGRLKNIRYKLYALRHEKRLYIEAEEKAEEKYKTGIQPGIGIEFTEANARPLYNIEGFLFQAKSLLDIMSLVLKEKISGFRVESFGKSKNEKGQDLAGEKIIKELKRLQGKIEFQELIGYVKSHQSWLTELVMQRDSVAHTCSIKALWFVESLYMGGDQLEVQYPHMPNNERVKAYLIKTEQKIHAFVKSFLEIACRIS
ncbi:MAG: hypothetical protein AAB592_03240 [Patescibacteria group bacterium]